MNIYVGNLSYGMSEDELRDAFGAFGEVSSVKILMDRETGRSRGFGFVEMPNNGEAETAIAQLNGKDIGGRALRINEARPREQREQRRGLGARGRVRSQRGFHRGGRPASKPSVMSRLRRKQAPRRYNRTATSQQQRPAASTGARLHRGATRNVLSEMDPE